MDQFIQRILVEEDALGSLECNSKLYDASADAGKELYTKGDLAKSKLPTIDAYLLKKAMLEKSVVSFWPRLNCLIDKLFSGWLIS